MPELIERIEDGVAVLTMNRPERYNAFTERMIGEMLAALLRLAADPNVGCVVLTGADGVFSAGGDAKEMARAGGGAGVPDRSTFERAVSSLRHAMECARLLHTMPKPTVASVPGAAAGAGLSLALACDLRIAASGAKLTTAFARVGLSGDFGGSYFLSRLVGTGKARQLYYLGDVILAEEAAGLGIVNRVVSPGELESEVMSVAKRLASGPRIALSYMKRNLNLAEEAGLEALFDQEAFFHARTAMTEDHAEGVAAFAEKRKPRFKGV